MKKALLIVCAVVCSMFFASAQKLTSYVEYWDYWQTQIKRKFTVLPNDVQHGTELWYDKTGTLTNTTVYDNGNVRSFKTHFRDGSIDTQGDVVQLPYAEERRSGNTGELLTLDLCRTFKDYHANRSVFIESKLYKQTRVDSLGNNYPFTIIGSDYGNEDAKLLNWRLESYSIKGAHWGSLTFTTSPDKTMEYLKCYSKEGDVAIDAKYDIYNQILTISTLANNEDFLLNEGYLSIKKPLCISDNGKVYDCKYDKTHIGTIRIPMDRKTYYDNITFAMKDDESGLRFIAVSPGGIYLDLEDVIKYVDKSKTRRPFLGRAFDLTRFGFANEENANGLMKLVDGSEDNGKYEFRSNHLDIDATYKDGIYSSFKITAYHCVYDGTAIAINGKNKSIKHPLSKNDINVYVPVIVPHGYGVLKEGDEAYKEKEDRVFYKKYEGNFVNGLADGQGNLYMKESGLITIYEGMFKNGLYSGKGKLHKTSNGKEIIYEGLFQNGTYHGAGILKENRITKSGIFSDGNLVSGEIIVETPEYTTLKYDVQKGIVSVALLDGCLYNGEPTKDIVEKYGRIFGLEMALDPVEINRHYFAKKTIKGVYVVANGNKYSGEFALKIPKRDNPNEFVTIETLGFMEKRLVKGLIDADTSEGRFVGEINNGKIDGKGKIVLKNGHIYKGQFANGVLDVYTPAEVSVNMLTGDKYEGEILNGKLHGKGCVKCANGDYYKGEFQFGKFMGTGNVRVTTKKGVYEGAVVSNQCQKVGTIKKIPAYKGVLPVEYVKVGTIQ